MENSPCSKEKPENILTRPETSVACSACIPSEEELAKFVSRQPRSYFYKSAGKKRIRRVRVELADGKIVRMLKMEALRLGLLKFDEPPAVIVKQPLKEPGHSEILDKLENVSPKKEEEQSRPPLPEEPRHSELLDKLENVSPKEEDERCRPPLPEEPTQSEILDKLENVSPKKEDERCRPPLPEQPRHSYILDKLENVSPRKEDEPCRLPSPEEPRHSELLDKLEKISPKKEDERPPLPGHMENSSCNKEEPENILTRPKTSVACSASIPTEEELAKCISQQPRSYFHQKLHRKRIRVQLADGKYMRMLKIEALRRGLITLEEPPAVNVQQHSLKEPGRSEILDKLENVSPKKEDEQSRPPLPEEPRQLEILDKLENVSPRKEDERCGPPVPEEPRHSELLDESENVFPKKEDEQYGSPLPEEPSHSKLLDELENVSPKKEDEQYKPPLQLPGNMENSPCSKEKPENILTIPETSVACSASIPAVRRN